MHQPSTFSRCVIHRKITLGMWALNVHCYVALILQPLIVPPPKIFTQLCSGADSKINKNRAHNIDNRISLLQQVGAWYMVCKDLKRFQYTKEKKGIRRHKDHEQRQESESGGYKGIPPGSPCNRWFLVLLFTPI